ncbi:Hypothetical predicted protein [Olea europaea subsp. europaea]|uniref:Uncharacterized protein n=1 Tax=Olea europaea subsp. europaea TaxID=158383 RepID=A0A8S0UDI4_OLEEU|nr:Hypothetical predicted protein [Olea europaea subsp. europaea]
MADGEEELCICPSFTSCSADRIAEIANKVTGLNTTDTKEDENNDDDFEFALVGENQRFLDEEFIDDGQIKQVFPVFNRDLLVSYDDYDKGLSGEGVESIRIPLKKNFMEKCKNDYPSSSSSEADELETIPPGTYCVWRPEFSKSSPCQCKKSKSTGSGSKRWKFRDLVRRCNSEGKDSFILLTPKHKEEKPKENVNSKKSKAKRVVSGEKSAANSLHEAFYVRNRAIKESDKRKSFLPYRQDLVGFFPNANGLGRRSFPAFWNMHCSRNVHYFLHYAKSNVYLREKCTSL